MLDSTEDYFAPHAEPASLFGNDVGHMPEAATVLPAEKIGDVEEAWGWGSMAHHWPEFAKEVAAAHADRDPKCECGACSR